jgi:hypothetical protein
MSSWLFLQWSLGILVGVGILLADRLWLVKWYTEEIGPTPNGDRQLITHSGLFLASFVVVAFFVLSSSGSFIGSGVVGGMAWGLALQMIKCRQRSTLSRHFFQDVKEPLSLLQEKWLVGGVTALAVIVTLLPLIEVIRML